MRPHDVPMRLCSCLTLPFCLPRGRLQLLKTNTELQEADKRAAAAQADADKAARNAQQLQQTVIQRDIKHGFLFKVVNRLQEELKSSQVGGG